MTTPLPQHTDLARLSLATVELPEPLTFGTSPAADLTLLRLLREATSHAVRLRWRLAGRPGFDPHTHLHLVPPSGGTDAACARYAETWARAYRYGSFYLRRGPGFVTVKDVRDGGEASRMVIDDGAQALLTLYDTETVTAARARCDSVTDELLTDAGDAGLLLRDNDHVLVLPYRMRHWPVPYVAV